MNWNFDSSDELFERILPKECLLKFSICPQFLRYLDLEKSNTKKEVDRKIDYKMLFTQALAVL